MLGSDEPPSTLIACDTTPPAEELELAARFNPNSPDPPFTLGVLEMQRGRFDDAEAHLKTALRLRPKNGDGWAILGSVYKQQNKQLNRRRQPFQCYVMLYFKQLK